MTVLTVESGEWRVDSCESGDLLSVRVLRVEFEFEFEFELSWVEFGLVWFELHLQQQD